MGVFAQNPETVKRWVHNTQYILLSKNFDYENQYFVHKLPTLENFM